MHQLHPRACFLVQLERVLDRAEEPQSRTGDQHAICVIDDLLTDVRIKVPPYNLQWIMSEILRQHGEFRDNLICIVYILKASRELQGSQTKTSGGSVE